MAERKQSPASPGFCFAVTALKTARPDSIGLQRERCERRKANQALSIAIGASDSGPSSGVV
jgi:hypothetical protein